jgi:rhomboid family GlyGly-CTERM serine protease
MGLNKANWVHRHRHALSDWSLPIGMISVAGLLALSGESGRQWARYERSGIESGELWRLISGHLAHLTAPHFALNAAGLVLVWYLVGACFETRRWLPMALAIIAGIDLGFWALEPQLSWYVGLSGLLHGLLAAGIVGSFRANHRDMWPLAMLLVAKIAYEQFVGPVPGSEFSAGGDVVVAAHFYGAVSGAIAGMFTPIRVRPKPSI